MICQSIAGPLRHYVDSLKGRIVLERLRAYAPELNPVEYLWAYAKQRELANLCRNTIGAIQGFARHCLKSMQHKPHVIAAC